MYSYIDLINLFLSNIHHLRIGYCSRGRGPQSACHTARAGSAPGRLEAAPARPQASGLAAACLRLLAPHAVCLVYEYNVYIIIYHICIYHNSRWVLGAGYWPPVTEVNGIMS